MRVLILETNLLWSARLRQTVAGIGHEPTVAAVVPEGDFDVAILNLGDAKIAPLVSTLKERGIPMVAHAGHKEKELMELGKGLGIDRLATNSELTNKLPQILDEFTKQKD